MAVPARAFPGLANGRDDHSQGIFGLAHFLNVERQAKWQLSVTARADAVHIKSDVRGFVLAD